MKTHALLLTAALTIAVFPVTSAEARQTGWINGFEWFRIAKTLSAKGEMPVSVKCKDSGSKGLTYKSGVANVRIEKNPNHIKWYWAFGNRVAAVKPKLEKQGYKLVSYSAYRRSSGLKVPCAIWHKK